jgi:hypothetical protein
MQVKCVFFSLPLRNDVMMTLLLQTVPAGGERETERNCDKSRHRSSESAKLIHFMKEDFDETTKFSQKRKKTF